MKNGTFMQMRHSKGQLGVLEKMYQYTHLFCPPLKRWNPVSSPRERELASSETRGPLGK